MFFEDIPPHIFLKLSLSLNRLGFLKLAKLLKRKLGRLESEVAVVRGLLDVVK